MLTLSQLKFAVDTSELDNAAIKIKKVSDAISALDAKQTRASVNQSKVKQAEAKAEKEQAQADKAKIQAEQAKAKAIRDTESATDANTKAVQKNVSILEKQEQILALMAQGFSRGQASIIATAKAAGTAADEINDLGKVLQAQRTIMGNDPFDKSLGSLRSLQNEFKVLKEVQRLYTAEIPLTQKQMNNLALDKMRLIEVAKIEGKSFSDLKQSIKNLNIEYINTAANVNRMTEADKAIVRSRQDAAKANEYLAKEMERVNFAGQEVNKGLTSGTNNALLRFERALKQSGMTVEEQSAKLDDYRVKLLALQQVQKKSNTDYISRALGPQITDIFVGLATGQAPLTVMLQQGGQLRDQFALAGVAAKDMGDVMRTAAKQMGTSIIALAGAFKDLLIGAIIDTGAGIKNMLSSMLGINAVVDATKRYFASLGEAGFKYIGVLEKIRVATNLAFGIGAVAGVTTLVALGIALIDVIKKENELTKALALNTGTFGMGLDSAVRYSQALSGASGTTEQFMQVIGSMAKEGGFAREEIATVGTAAIQMSKYFQVSIDDTVKAFAKLKEDPVKNLIELAKQTGLVSDATIKSVIEFEKQGNKAAATALAIKSMADVNSEQVERMKKDYNNFSLFIMDLGTKISQFFSNAFKDLFRVDGDAMRKSLELVDKEIAKRTNANGEANMFQGSAVEAFKTQRENLLNAIAIRDIEEKAAEQKIQDNQKQVKQTEFYNNLRLKGVTEVMKKEDELVKLRASIKANPARDDEERLIALDAEKKLLKEIEDAKKKYADKPDKKTENYFAQLMREATNNTLEAVNATNELTKSEMKLLEVHADDRYKKLSADRKAEVDAKYKSAIASEKLNQVEELREKLLGKSSRLGKDYFDTLNQIVKLYNGGSGNITESEFNQMLKSLNESTPAARELAKQTEAMNNAMSKYAENAQSALDKVQQENEGLELREQLLGKNTEEQRKIRIEYERNIALLKVESALHKEINRILNDERLDKYPEKRAQAIVDAENVAVAQRLAINREVAVKSAEYLMEEYNRIRDGISASIVTALFEGGKAGRKKLRDVIVAELSKPITITINAIVNTLLGDTIKNLVGTLSGGGSGGFSLSGLSDLFTSGGGSVASLFGNVSSFGANIFSKGFEGLGGTLMDWSNTLAKYTGVIDKFGQGLGYVTSILALTKGKVGQGLGGAIGTFFGGPVGSFIGSAIGKFLDKAFGGETRIGGQFAVAYDGTVTNNRRNQSYSYVGQQYDRDFSNGERNPLINGNAYRLEGDPFSNAGDKAITDTVSMTAKSINDLLKSLGSAASLTGFWAGLETSGKNRGGVFAGGKLSTGQTFGESGTGDNYAGTLYEKFSSNSPDFDQAIKDFTLDLKQSALQALSVVADIPEVVKNLVKNVDIEGLTETEVDALLKQINEMVVGVSTLKASFESMGLDKFANISFDAATELAKVAGGFDTLQKNLSSYYDEYYSEEEKQQNILRTLTKAFNEQNLVLPKTREEYRKLVESQDLSTESGRALYALLLQLAPAFAEITDAGQNSVDKLKDIADQRFDLEQQILEASGQSAEALRLRREKELDAYRKLDPALADLAQRLYDLQDAASAYARFSEVQDKKFDIQQRLLIAQGKNREALDLRRLKEYYALLNLNPELAAMVIELYKAEDAAEALKKAEQDRADMYSRLEKAVAAEKAVLAERIQSTEASITALKSFFDVLKNGVDELYNQVESTSQMSYMAARALINSTFTSVKAGGSVTPNDALTQAVQTSVSGIKASDFSTKTDYDRERLRLAAQLNVLKDSTQKSLTAEEKILEALKEQDRALDATLEYWKKQIEIANGTYEATLSVAEAIANLSSALGFKPESTKPLPVDTLPGTTNNGGASFGGTSPSFGQSSLGGFTIDADGRAIYADGSKGLPRDGWMDATGKWNWAPNSPLNPANAGKNLPPLPAFAAGGMYNGGVALVGERGPELINFNKPASIYSNSNTGAILNNAADNEELRKTNRMLLEKLDKIAENTKKASDTLRNVTPNGDSFQVESESFLEI